MGALGAGVTAGVGSAAVASGTWLAAQGSNTAGIVAGVGRAAIGSVVTQGLAVAVGLQDHFSWMQVATAAASSAVGSLASNAANDAMGYNPQKGFDFTKSLISGAAAGIAAGTTAAVMRGGRVQVEQIATDAFGNALGSSLAENADSTNSSQVQVLADTVSQQQPSGLVDPLYGISLGINPTYVNAPQPMFADMTAPYAGSSASAQEQELANTVSQPSGGLVDPLYGTSLGVNPTYASTPQSMFADTPAPYANAGESGQLQSVGVQPQMLAASWNGPVAPSYSNSTPVTDALTDAFPTSANGNPPSGEPLDAMGRDLARAGVFGPYSAAKAAADADPGVLLASVDVNRRPRDEMLLEGGGGGPGLGGGGGRSFAGESSGTGRAGLMDAAEAEGVAGARSIREGIY